jgi:hypothetical protein
VSYELIAIVLIGVEIVAGFSAAYWALASIAGALATIDERTERIARYLATGPRE